MSTKKKTEGRYPLPKKAQEHILEMRSQLVSIQAQLQQFVDGVLIGMGVDIEQNPEVDVESMTVILKKSEEKNASQS
jgi:hypothetical protein